MRRRWRPRAPSSADFSRLRHFQDAHAALSFRKAAMWLPPRQRRSTGHLGGILRPMAALGRGMPPLIWLAPPPWKRSINSTFSPWSAASSAALAPATDDDHIIEGINGPGSAGVKRKVDRGRGGIAHVHQFARTACAPRITRQAGLPSCCCCVVRYAPRQPCRRSSPARSCPPPPDRNHR